MVEAVGIEPYCRRYANPTRTLGFPRIVFKGMQPDLLPTCPGLSFRPYAIPSSAWIMLRRQERLKSRDSVR